METPIWLRSKEGLLPFVELNGKEYHDSAFIMAALLKLCNKEATEVRFYRVVLLKGMSS